jgi:phosphoribosyl-ATP pyrophosphohydrolase
LTWRRLHLARQIAGPLLFDVSAILIRYFSWESLCMNQPDSMFARLMAIIEDRKANPPAKSYTTTLFAGGVPKIGGKILEEAREVVEAADEPGPEGENHLVHEAADLVYHLLVMLGHRGVKLEQVEAELGRRFGVSGLDEKAARPQRDH